MAYTEALTKAGVFVGSARLQSSSSATTVRLANGKSQVLDGPYADSKEQLAGYYILDCKDLDEAIAWAAKIPTACGGGEGCIEIRPLRELSRSLQGEPAQAQYVNALNG